MKPANITRNIVLIFNRSIVNDFNSDDIKGKFELVFDEVSVQMGSTELENFKAVFTTSAPQVQAIAQENKLIIVDNTIISDSESISADFSKLVHNIAKYFIVDKAASLQHYGFNYSFSYESTSIPFVQESLKSKYFKEDTLMDDQSVANLEYKMPTIRFSKADNLYVINYALDVNDSSEPQRFIVGTNVTFNSSTFPDSADEIHKSYKSEFEYLSTHLINTKG